MKDRTSTPSSRSPLQDGVARYVATAIPIVTSNLQPGELIGLPGGRWQATGNGQFQRRDDVRVSWVAAIGRRHGALHALAEYGALVDLITARDDWRPQFGTLVGTQHSRTRLDLDWFLDSCLDSALVAQLEGRNPQIAATERAAGIERLLDAEALEGQIVGPLFGFQSPFGRISLSSDMAIEPIDEVEVERLVSMGLLAPFSPHLPFLSAPSHIARATWRAAKVIGESVDQPAPQALIDESKTAQEDLDRLLVALRLLQPGLVRLGATATVQPSVVGLAWQGPSGHASLTRHPFPTYLLDDDERVAELAQLWERLNSPGVRRTRHLELAARRFAYRGDRDRVDDQLVDLMVAAEALFLGDTDEEGRGELRFRLSSRAAGYIQHPIYPKRSIYHAFMAAYRMRSRLVHGGNTHKITLDGESVTPERVVERTEDMLRVGLQQALEEAANKPAAKWSVDWDTLLFP